MTPELPLFVYGTLSRAGGQAAMIGPTRRGPATTRGALYQMPAGYPALDPRGDGTVYGEWTDPIEPARLALLDLYEGVPEGLYERVTIEVTTASSRFTAWSWIMFDPARRGGRRLPSGRWRPVVQR